MFWRNILPPFSELKMQTVYVSLKQWYLPVSLHGVITRAVQIGGCVSSALHWGPQSRGPWSFFLIVIFVFSCNKSN
jgi:hypothetical protein